MSLQMWKTVMWFFFFSMIKRMLQPSKSMLSSNLCETWDLKWNESIMKLLVIDRVQQLLIVFGRYASRKRYLPAYLPGAEWYLPAQA